MTRAASGFASARIALGHPREPTGVVEQRARDLGHAAELRLGNVDRAAAALEVARVQRLVIRGRERIRDEDRRQAGRGELPHRPARAHDREVARAVRGAEPVEHGDEPVVRSRDATLKRTEVALAADVQHRRADRAERVDRELVQRARAGPRAGDQQAPARSQATRAARARPSDPSDARSRGSAARRRGTSRRRAPASRTRGRRGARTEPRAGSQGRAVRRLLRRPRASASAPPRTPSGPRHSRRRRTRRRDAAARGSAGTRPARARRAAPILRARAKAGAASPRCGTCRARSPR